MNDPASAPTVALLHVGSVLADRYELQAMLGEGGMGAVFRGHDRELDELVAVKILHTEFAKDVASLTRFRREVKLARRVTHKNVARTFDLGVHDDVRFLTMELVAGPSLGRRAAEAPLQLAEILRVVAEIGHGLAAAHAAGVVHRDLKPDNVLVTEDRVVLTDFGIARVADGGIEVMRTGSVIGTPAYMAPEQLENRAIDGRTDVYALGVMLFELLAGRLPFVGQTPYSVAAARLTSDAPDVRTIAPATPEGVADLVRDLLVRRREDRPDAPTIVDRIETLRGNAGVHRRGRAREAQNFGVTHEAVTTLVQPRTVLVQPFTADAGHERLASVLETAVADSLVESRIAQVLVRDVTASSRDGATPGSMPPSSVADLVVQGTIHVAKERVRARLRVLDRRRTSPLWAGHVDGTVDDSLDLEDRVVAAVGEAVRWRTARDPGPRDPALREPYERARVAFDRFGFPDVREAIAILEEVEARKPGDPRIRSLLAHALLRLHTQTGARGHAVPARAEELALRALDDDDSVADAHHVIATVRYFAGELAAALRAAEAVLRQSPLYGEAHYMIGKLLCESLYVEDGRRRVELAARLEPRNGLITLERVRLAALLDGESRAREMLREAKLKGGPLSLIVLEIMLPFWWSDKDLARQTAAVIRAAQAGASWDAAVELMDSYVAGVMHPHAHTTLAELAGPGVAPRHRCMMHEVAAEYFAKMDDRESALHHLSQMQRLPQTDLLWLDRCPALDGLRDDPRFAETRAAVAARVADLWS
ncbi:hypothetical protein BH09MYX1_BH09MYX1_15370 [soil metagenome]